MDNYTLVIPAQAGAFTNMMMFALTIWREASSEALEAKQAVAWAIRNRVNRPGWWGKNLYEVVTKPSQFSSMVPPDHVNDPNLRRYPDPNDPSWIMSLKVAFDVWLGNVTTPIGDAEFYYDKSLDQSPPPWAAQYTHVADIGRFHFYKSK